MVKILCILVGWCLPIPIYIQLVLSLFYRLIFFLSLLFILSGTVISVSCSGCWFFPFGLYFTCRTLKTCLLGPVTSELLNSTQCFPILTEIFLLEHFFLLSFMVFSDFYFSSFNNLSHTVVTMFLELFVQKCSQFSAGLFSFFFFLILLWSFIMLLIDFFLRATYTYHGKVSW